MDFATARYRMIQNQIRTNRVTDPLIIDAMGQLERERFLPESLRGIAYVDEDIPLGGGRFLIEPLTGALLLQAAEIDADDVVLDVGCGPGYLSAIIARMASAVVALESDAALAEQSRRKCCRARLELRHRRQGSVAERLATAGAVRRYCFRRRSRRSSRRHPETTC